MSTDTARRPTEDVEAMLHDAASAMEGADATPRAQQGELEAYMRELRHFPVLKRDDQYAYLFHKLRHAPAPVDRLKARDLLVYGNIRLVISIAKQYRRKGMPLRDRIQEGVIGLMTAIEKFDPERGFKFSTYATNWIRQGITRALADYSGKYAYRIPVHYQGKVNFARKHVAIFQKHNGRFPTDLELYRSIKTSDTKMAESISLADVVDVHKFIVFGYVSHLESPIGEDGGTLGDLMPDYGKDVEQLVEARQMYTQAKKAVENIEAAVERLDPRSAMIIRLRYGLGEFERMTLEETAERYELTRERVRQVQVKALERLSEELEVTGDEIAEIIDLYEELAKLVHRD